MGSSSLNTIIFYALRRTNHFKPNLVVLTHEKRILLKKAKDLGDRKNTRITEDGERKGPGHSVHFTGC